MPSTGRNIIVIGTSAGGLEALDTLIGELPPDLPAAIFIVQHLSPENSATALLTRLGKYTAFASHLAKNGEHFQPGKIYVARSDYHLLVKKQQLLVTKGARENRYRPSIDALFRSAATTHGARVIGVILTGMLDDGTAGLIAIHQCGGITVVQDPNDATYPDMPQSALNNLAVDHCVPLAQMGALLTTLTHEHPGKTKRLLADLQTEAKIAERVLSDVAEVNGLGTQVPYNCPNCGGVLWEMNTPTMTRYRCHTGHSFTPKSLLTSQSEKIEETLWTSLRMFEERKNLLNKIAGESTGSLQRSYTQRAKETQIHIERLRAIMLAPSPMNVASTAK